MPRRLKVLLVVSLTLAATSALYILFVYLTSFNGPETAIQHAPHERSKVPPGPPVVERLVVIVLDGVRREDALTLEELAPLREKGAFRPLLADYPTYTFPNITTMVTGVPPRDSGVRLNGDDRGTPGLDSVSKVAADHGLRVEVWPREFAPFGGLTRHDGRGQVVLGRLGAEVAEILQDRRPPERGLRWVHVDEVDHAAHESGLASEAYRNALKHAGALVVSMAARMNFERDGLVVLSDHGHVDAGGHGGDEPAAQDAFFLALGGSIAPGKTLGGRPMRDVASTLAVLLGLPTPSSNEGRPMLDMLDVPNERRATLLASPYAQAAERLCDLRPAAGCKDRESITSRLQQGDPGTLGTARDSLQFWVQGRDAALASLDLRGRIIRLGLVGALLAWGFNVVRYRTKTAAVRGTREGFILLALLLAVYAVAFRLQGYGLSFSRMAPGDLFFPAATKAGAVAVLVTLLLAYLRRSGERGAWGLLGAAYAPFLLLAAWVGTSTSEIAPPLEGVAVFYAGPLLLAASATALVLGMVTMLRGERLEETLPQTAVGGVGGAQEPR